MLAGYLLILRKHSYCEIIRLFVATVYATLLRMTAVVSGDAK
jgi:hypothetical protein